jgi:hypothetical protein
MAGYRALDPVRVIQTIELLRQRISERFPGAGLVGVVTELLQIAKESSVRAERISRRNIPLRVAIYALLAVGAGGLVWIVRLIDFSRTSADSVYSVLQGMEAAANLVVLIGAALFFLITVEERLKRRRALRALHELRSIVHVIDMHQLTKDPSAEVSIAGKTASSPARTLTRFELTRYLDYCAEMLSLASKVAVLYAQGFPDAVIVEVVSDLERIAAGLSQKIWQKIMILAATAPAEAAAPSVAATAPAVPR